MKPKWVNRTQFTTAQQQILAAYDIFCDGLHHTNNVVRWISDDRLVVQRSGRINYDVLSDLSACGYQIEVDAVAPGIINIWIERPLPREGRSIMTTPIPLTFAGFRYNPWSGSAAVRNGEQP